MIGKPFRVIITGDRNWACHEEAQRIVDGLRAKHGPEVVIVEGGADGVDMAFHAAAVDRGLAVESYPVSKEDWRRLGKRAGPLRNGHMVSLGADLCIAVHRNILESKGTKDCVIQASDAGIPVWLVQGDGKAKRLTPDKIAAIRGDWEPEEDWPRDDGIESEAEACAILADEAVPFEEVLLRGEYPQFGQPRVGWWSHVLGSIQQYNGRWKGDHPTEAEPIHWDEVVIHLAWVTSNAKLHSHNPMNESLKPEDWVPILAGVHGSNTRSPADADFMDAQLIHYLESALKRAEERLQAPTEPPAPPPPPERHKGRKAPPPPKAVAEAKLDKASKAKASGRSKRPRSQ
jgi:hypothetical protein